MKYQKKINRQTIVKAAMAFLFLAAIVVTTSCKKDGSIIDSFNSQTTKDESAAESEFNEILQLAEEAVDSAMLQTWPATTLSIASCAIANIDTVNNTITIDFGTSGCLGADGRTRSGKIIINYLGYYREPGSSISIVFDNFTIDGNSVSGEISYKTLNRDANNHLKIVTTISNGMVQLSNGNNIQYNTSRTVTWVEGELTGDLYDDVFETIGGSNGISSLGLSFSMNIIEPIVSKSACWNQYIYYPVSGIKQILLYALEPRTIDFGNGNCDKEVTITVGHNDYIVTLP